jgi:uridine kinase
MDELERLILTRRRDLPATRAVLAGVTGIDGSGKGYVTARLANRLRGQGLNVAAIGIDGWLNLPAVRFDPANPAEQFYLHALRFDALFAQLVLPLRDRRTLRLEADYAEETATAYCKHVYDFADADVILLEGIFLLKREYRGHFDLSVWLDCTFETALERALSRRQEGLPPAETVRAYETIYFPAQRIHLERDNPRAAASRVIPNDPRLQARTTGPAGAAG